MYSHVKRAAFWVAEPKVASAYHRYFIGDGDDGTARRPEG